MCWSVCVRENLRWRTIDEGRDDVALLPDSDRKAPVAHHQARVGRDVDRGNELRLGLLEPERGRGQKAGQSFRRRAGRGESRTCPASSKRPRS